MQNANSETTPNPDVQVDDQGTIVMFTPLSETGQLWIDENVFYESWQMLGPSLGVDHRMADGLVVGMQEAGLIVLA